MEKKKIYRNGCLLCFVALVFIILSSTTTFGAVIRVPGDYSTIQAGINAASNGDTVSVADGTYVGLGNKDLDFHGKAITVKSDNGPENCVIDCEGNGRGFFFHSSETQSSIVSGFTITKGKANLGGGILCSSSPTIINCKIINNTAESAGGGIFCDFRCTITNCIIAGNTAVWGGGICINGAPVPVKITNCTITGNTASHGCIMNIDNSYATITNCILWGGKVRIALGEFNRIPQFNYCDIEDDGVTGATIIHLPPLFVDVSDTSPIKWDLHLLSSSPCIDSGTSEEAPDFDIDGKPRPQSSGYDIGAYEYGGPSPPDAKFSATPTSGASPLTVNFADQSTGTVDSWNWSFGDNSTSNDQNPSHTYNDSGSYTVTLNVSGPEGSDAETKPDYIKVIYPSDAKAMPWIPLLLLDEDKKLPMSGMWTGSAGFGELSFTVNATGTGITQIIYHYIDFSCGIYTYVDMTSTHNFTTPLSITNSQFTHEYYSSGLEMTLSGTIGQTGMSASGTYKTVVDGTICQGNWDATPN